MISFDDAELPSLPTEGDLTSVARFKSQERTRRTAEGELSVHIDSLIQVLGEKHGIDRLDRTLEFFNPDVIIPSSLNVSQIDSVSICLGEATPEIVTSSQDPTELYVTIRIQSDESTFVINRSNDPSADPDEVQDYVESPVSNSADSVEIRTTPLEQNLSKAEINALLFSLVNGYATPATDLIAEYDFLSQDNFVLITNELEQKATNRRISGAHAFNDGLSELEFTESDYIEYFEFTHTIIDGINPRTLAISASSAGGTYMQYVQQNGTDIRVSKPQVGEIDILKNVVLKEVSRLERESAPSQTIHAVGSVALLDMDLIPSNDIATDEIDRRIDSGIFLDASVDRLVLDDFTDDLDQDGLNPPDSSAA